MKNQTIFVNSCQKNKMNSSQTTMDCGEKERSPEKICLRKVVLSALIYPYPLSRQKTGLFKVDSSPYVKAVGTKGARRATGVPTATPYTSAGVR